MVHENQDELLLIIGAGFAGRSLAREIQQRTQGRRPLVFLDDDPAKFGRTEEGIPVDGPLSQLAQKYAGAPEAIIAIPSATKGQLKDIYEILQEAGVGRIRILPGISQIIEGEAHLALTREIDPQDLLGRNPVHIHLKKSLSYLRGKRVLITGAGGSIGSELARQLLSGGAERLYLMGHGENSIYQIDRELRRLQSEGVGEKAVIVPVIGELRDPEYVHFLLSRLRADVIFHCAAHKHVPLMEANPLEAVINNAWGTLHLVQAARELGTPRFVLISTDKAVSPSSVYGITKKLSEEIVLQADSTPSQRSRNRFMVVRFGNVLGSRGSILPLFREQILAGGPVTITNPEVKRFFMTIPEAASLVLQTGGVGENGQLYLLDMGEALNIEDLACQVMEFYGRRPRKDVQIQYIGLRPGEKLEERLWEDYEEPVPTEFARINRVVRRQQPLQDWPHLMEDLRPLCFFDPERAQEYRNRRKLRAILKTRFPSLLDKEDEPEY